MKFKKLTPSDYSGLRAFFAGQKYLLCTYSLPSIIAWTNEIYQPYGAVEGDTLWIYVDFVKHQERNHLILPISPTAQVSPEQLHSFASAQGMDQYRFVPEAYLQTYGKERVQEIFKVTRHVGFSDYVYRTEDLAKLKGNKYSKKRNLIHQFNRAYLNQGRVSVEWIAPEHSRECIDFLEKWCLEQNCEAREAEDLACEKRAAQNTLENIEALNIQGVFCRIDGQISAIGIGTHLTENMGVLHFEKAFSNIKGLYQFFDRECARRLFKNYEFINKENDMNIPGLAQSKKSYHPAMMVESFRLELR